MQDRPKSRCPKIVHPIFLLPPRAPGIQNCILDLHPIFLQPEMRQKNGQNIGLVFGSLRRGQVRRPRICVQSAQAWSFGLICFDPSHRAHRDAGALKNAGGGWGPRKRPARPPQIRRWLESETPRRDRKEHNSAEVIRGSSSRSRAGRGVTVGVEGLRRAQ